MLLRMAPLRPHIGVVVAGHDGDILRLAKPRKERARGRELGREREIDEIAGDRDVVDGLRLEVGHDAIEYGGAVEVPAPFLPVDVAADPLAHELERRGRRQRREMRVRQVRQHEGRHQDNSKSGYELPMRMPARKTSVPPITTWNAAERNGVSI